MNKRRNVKDLRDWINLLEESNELRHITAKVDWNEELGAITRKVSASGGPALLFENIKGYKNTACNKLFTNGLGSRKRLNLALGLPLDSDDRKIVTILKDRLTQRVETKKVDHGPVKENIIRGDKINLFDFPVPRWNFLDGGRYINTLSCQVTMDPDTKLMNVGMYRGMIGSKNTIPVLLCAPQHWGAHFAKYRARGEDMPIAVVYGWDPVLLVVAATAVSHPGCSEYEVAGALRQSPVELVQCETSGLWVPASAEIVIEGKISADPNTFEMEGPFAEYVGYYGGAASPKHVIRVECITYRNNPIFRGGLEGGTPGSWAEPYYWHPQCKCAVIWNYLESLNLAKILGVWASPITRGTDIRVQIETTYRGQARQIAHAIWGSHLMNYTGKLLIVVDEDIDVFSDEAVEWALAYRVNAARGDVEIAHGCIGTNLDPSIPLNERDSVKYGHGTWSPVFLDATIDWNLEPQAQYGNKRFPPKASEVSPKTEQLVKRRWQEYGL